jgi:hypothetical protein
MGIENPLPVGEDILIVNVHLWVKISYRMGMPDIYSYKCAALGHDVTEHERVVGERGRQVFQRHGNTATVAVRHEN